MNILITCVGRRDYIVDYFREALGGTGRVIATNSYAETAGMFAADESIVVPPIGHPEYINTLLEVCENHKVRMLISLFDIDLQVLAFERNRFLEIGTIPLVPSPEVANLCNDKWLTYQFANQYGINTPKTFISITDVHHAIAAGELEFPLVLKPRWGSGSIGLEYPNDKLELDVLYQKVKRKISSGSFSFLSEIDPERNILIQERLLGAEYGLDIVNDFSGEHVACFIKQKIEMRAGETDRGMTVLDSKLARLGSRIGKILRSIGLISVDIIRASGQEYLIEINPRFSGHYPFTHAAGGNIPAVLVAWMKGQRPDRKWLRVEPNVLSCKGIRLLTDWG